MRPIDADAIHYCNYDLDNYHSFRAVEDDEIADMPTLTLDDIVPHGRWKVTEDGDWECSNCKEAVTICVCGKDKTRYKPFCPNCMAKMDLE